MTPTSAWDAAGRQQVVAALGAKEYVFKVWGGDWCSDCRSQLPDFAAALDAAGVPEKRIEQFAAERDEDGEKVGPEMDEYGVEYIPTVVVEHDGEEVARFVEEEPVPIAVYLAERLQEAEAKAEAEAET